MKMEAIHTNNAPAAIGPYSQAIRANGFVFVSGQIPIDPKTAQLVGEDLPAQAGQSLENMKQVLLAAGSGLESVVSVDVFITDMSQFGAFNQVYETFFSTNKPARAVVEVSTLPRGVMVEVKCVAIL